MERIVERPGALDVHKASVTACVRVWHQRTLEEHVAEFQTTVQGLLALRDWLEALAVKQVAMEATGASPVARPTSRTRNGSASCWRPAYCARAWCRRSRSARCAT